MARENTGRATGLPHQDRDPGYSAGPTPVGTLIGRRMLALLGAGVVGLSMLTACADSETDTTVEKEEVSTSHAVQGNGVISAQAASGVLARTGALLQKAIEEDALVSPGEDGSEPEEGQSSAEEGQESETDHTSESTPEEEESVSASPSETNTCAPYTGRQAAYKWGEKLRAPEGVTWNLDVENPRTYDPCAPLSYLVISPEGYRSGQLHQIMLFHYGEYLGTTGWLAYETQVEVTQTAPDRVVVLYRWGSNCSGADCSEATSTFTWDDVLEKVVHGGQFPPDSLGV